MQLYKPQVHLKKQETDPGVFIYHIHVVTWMDYTKYVADGNENISTTLTDGVYKVTLKIREESSVPNMHLLTPVVHTLTLTGMTFLDTAIFLEVECKNSTANTFIAKRKVHRDDADNSAMPIPDTDPKT